MIRSSALIAAFFGIAISCLADESKPVLFPIGGYSPQPTRDKAAGFTIAGPTYKDSRRLLEECEKAGIDMIYRLRTSIDLKGKKGLALTSFNEEEVRREIREQVEAVASSKRIHSWTISPEELRFWRPLELAYLRLVAEEVKASDPKKRPVWNYEPGHRDAASLGKMLPYMGVSAKGMYVNYSDRLEERVWCRWSLRQQSEAIRASNDKALFFALPEMFRQPPAGTEGNIRAWVRHDTYSSLLEGAQGILIYSFASRKQFPAYDDYYNAYAEVARELNDPELLGSVFAQGIEKEPVSHTVTIGPKTLTLSPKPPMKDAVTYPTVAMKRIEHGNREFLFLINSAAEPVTLNLGPSEDSWIEFPEQQNGRTSRGEISLKAWEVLILIKAS